MGLTWCEQGAGWSSTYTASRWVGSAPRLWPFRLERFPRPPELPGLTSDEHRDSSPVQDAFRDATEKQPGKAARPPSTHRQDLRMGRLTGGEQFVHRAPPADDMAHAPAGPSQQAARAIELPAGRANLLLARLAQLSLEDAAHRARPAVQRWQT